MKTKKILTMILILATNLIAPATLYGAASPLAEPQPQLSPKDISQHLINLYTDMLLNETSAPVKLNFIIHALLMDDEGKLVLSIAKNIDALNLEAFTAHYLPKGKIQEVSPKLLAEFIHIVQNNSSNNHDILYIKKLLYTAVQHNLLNNLAYRQFSDELPMINSMIDTLNTQLAQDDSLYDSDDDINDDSSQKIKLPITVPKQKAPWYRGWSRK